MRFVSPTLSQLHLAGHASHSQRPNGVAIRWEPSMGMGVGPKFVGQDEVCWPRRIAGIRFGPAGPVPVAITGNCVRIDGVDGPYRTRATRQPGAGLSSRSRSGLFVHAFATLSEQTDKLGEASGTDADPPFRQ